MLWHLWLGGRKGIRLVKTEWWGAGMVICLERRAVLHMAQLMPLPPTVSCFSKIQIGFTFLVLACPGSPGKRAVKRVYVCMYLHASNYLITRWHLQNWKLCWCLTLRCKMQQSSAGPVNGLVSCRLHSSCLNLITRPHKMSFNSSSPVS